MELWRFVCAAAVVVVASLALLPSAYGAATITAIASFDSNGVAGHLTFTQVDSDPTSVSVSLTGLPAGQQLLYAIHQYPMDRSTGSCSVASTGNHFDPFGVGGAGYDCQATNFSTCEVGDLSAKHGTLAGAGSTAVTTSYTDETLVLSSKLSIIGHSVVISEEGGSRIACADIIQQTSGSNVVSELVANFVDGPIYGRFIFKQVDNGDTLFYFDLSSVGDQGPYSYHIHRSPIASPNNCASAGAHFDPFGANTGAGYSCDSSDFSTCEVGDLSGKFGKLTPDSSGRVKGVFTDPTIDLLKGNMIIGTSVVIHNNAGGRVACANVVHPNAVATFTGENGITGEITFSSINGGVDVQLFVGIYDIGKSQILPFHINTNGVYGEGDTSSANGVFDPFDVIQGPSYSCDAMDKSTCAVGDLSIKWSGISSSSQYSCMNEIDDTIAITDILYRALVIDNNDGSPLTCANIVLKDDVHLQAIASFVDSGNANVDGKIMFSQINHGPTSVWVTLKGLSNGVSYGYQIFENPIDELCSCGPESVGNTYDPLLAGSAGSGYECDPQTPCQCEVGDLSGKWGNIVGVSDPTQYVISKYQDNNLSLMGQYSVLGRSLSLLTGSTRYICANIVPKLPRDAPVYDATVCLESPSSIVGTVWFRQIGSDGDVTIFMELSTTITEDLTYTINQYPVSQLNDCEPAGDAYDPLLLSYQTGDYDCDPADFSSCKVGDLSGRFGTVKATSGQIRHMITDPVLNLNGPDNVVGLSLVFKTNLNSVGCANIFTPVLTVEFSGLVMGGLTFANNDGQGVQVNGAFMAGLEEGSQYPYHIHTTAVPSSTECAAANGHYDPFNARRVGEPYYCSSGDLGCEVGDLASKHGSLIGAAQDQTVWLSYNDKTISLFDLFGRSVVIHRSDGSRLICENIHYTLASDLVISPPPTTPPSTVIPTTAPTTPPEGESESHVPYRKTAGFGALIMLIVVCVVAVLAYFIYKYYRDNYVPVQKSHRGSSYDRDAAPIQMETDNPLADDRA